MPKPPKPGPAAKPGRKEHAMKKMTRDEYLEAATEAYNAGRISAEAYDACIANADIFTDTEDDDSGIDYSYYL
jgi:hypothetical protein